MYGYVPVPAPQLGHAIKVYRTARNMSQMDLASKCHLTSGGMSLIERGARTPSLEVLGLICQALNVTFSTLFMFAENGGGEVSISPVKTYG